MAPFSFHRMVAFRLVITKIYLFPFSVVGNSPRMSIATRSIGNPAPNNCIGALLVFVGHLRFEQTVQPAMYWHTSF